jgi:hypothetical protein
MDIGSSTAAEEPAPAPEPAVEPAASPSESAAPEPEETVFWEGHGSTAELIFSTLMLATLIYAPLSFASIGRRLWIFFKYVCRPRRQAPCRQAHKPSHPAERPAVPLPFRFTNKRICVINTSPLFKRTLEVSYKNVKEVRTAPRGLLGMWGDVVVFLRDGSRLEMTGLSNYKELADYVNRQCFTL